MSVIRFKSEVDLNNAGIVIDPATGEAMPTLVAMTKAVNCRCDKWKKMYGESQTEYVGIGNDLIVVHAYIQSHKVAGGFSGWIDHEFALSRSQAYRMMAIAQEFADCPNLGHYCQSALYALAQVGTPPAAKEEARRLADSGEFVSHTTAVELVRKHRPGVHEEAEAEAVTATAPVEARESGQPTTEDNPVSEEEQEANWEAVVQEAELQNGTNHSTPKNCYTVMVISPNMADLELIKSSLPDAVITKAKGEVIAKAWIEKTKIDQFLAEVGQALKDQTPKKLSLSITI